MFLIPRLLKHAAICKASGTLIAPKWPSAPFWPLLFPNGTHPAGFVSNIWELPRMEYLIMPGHSESTLFKGVPNTMVFALHQIP